jgi:phosphohistidine phosphatase SixA
MATLWDAAGVSTIFTSSFRRTKQTVQPLAARLGIQDREAPPVSDLVREVKSGEVGPVILIAGHSNTVPQIIEAFGVQVQIPVIGDREFDSLFVVTLISGRSGQGGAERDEARLLHLKYGKPSS